MVHSCSGNGKIFKNPQTYGITRGRLALEKFAIDGVEAGFMRFIGEFFRNLRTPLYRNAIFLMANTVVASGIGFFFWMVVAGCYTPHEVGLAAAIIPVIAFLGMLSRFGFDIGLVRFLPSSGKNSRAMINSSFTISGAAAILISFIFLMGLDIWSPALLFIRENRIFFSSFTLFSLMNQVFVARRNAKFVLAGSLASGLRIALPRNPGSLLRGLHHQP
ncbi:MAG: lipopolysaccharide biosynthesis protein [Thermoplasmata archaeon]